MEVIIATRYHKPSMVFVCQDGRYVFKGRKYEYEIMFDDMDVKPVWVAMVIKDGKTTRYVTAESELRIVELRHRYWTHRFARKGHDL